MDNLTLYKIEDEYRALMAMLEENGGDITEDMAAIMNANEENFVAKSTNYARMILYYEQAAEAAKREKERIAAFEGTAKKAAENMKAALAAAMTERELDRMECDNVRLSFRRSAATVIDDAQAVPDEYCTVKVERVPDKTAIKNAIKAGAEISGAHVEERRSLQIK